MMIADAAQERKILRGFAIDSSCYGHHVVLGRLIVLATDHTCSHCHGPAGANALRVKLLRRDPFWFQYCDVCGDVLDKGLHHIRLVKPK